MPLKKRTVFSTPMTRELLSQFVRNVTQVVFMELTIQIMLLGQSNLIYRSPIACAECNYHNAYEYYFILWFNSTYEYSILAVIKF